MLKLFLLSQFTGICAILALSQTQLHVFCSRHFTQTGKVRCDLRNLMLSHGRSLLPALEHLRTIDALSTEAISRQRCHALRVLSLDIDAVAFNIRVQEESEIIERLRTTKMHERPECDLRFVLGVYVSLVDSS